MLTRALPQAPVVFSDAALRMRSDCGRAHFNLGNLLHGLGGYRKRCGTTRWPADSSLMRLM